MKCIYGEVAEGIECKGSSRGCGNKSSSSYQSQCFVWKSGGLAQDDCRNRLSTYIVLVVRVHCNACTYCKGLLEKQVVRASST